MAPIDRSYDLLLDCIVTENYSSILAPFSSY